LLIILSISILEALIDCDNVVNDSTPFTGKCNNKWKNLKTLIRPTQPQVGYAWIANKLNNDFSSSNDAQSEMDDSILPAVLGPGSKIYIVDDHHTLCALDYSGYSDTTVTINIICDKRTLSEASFWTTLDNEDLAYLASHPTGKPDVLPIPISYTEMPTSFSFTSTNKVFTDDHWRSMAGYSRKVQSAASPAPSCSSNDDKYCERCMFRGCVDGYKTSGTGVPYFEFSWSYFMNDATFYNTKYWVSSNDLNKFKSLYLSLPDSTNIDKVDPDDWLNAASYVISLCRSSTTSSYKLPSSIYPNLQSLPGYVSGYLKLDTDPTCSAPACA